MITREQCLKWAEEAGLINEHNRDLLSDRMVCSQIEALCQRVWNEAMEAAAQMLEAGVIGHGECAEDVRNLKVKP